MGIVTVEIKNFFNKEVFCGNINKELCRSRWCGSVPLGIRSFQLPQVRTFALHWADNVLSYNFGSETGTISFCETLWKRLKMPHCLEFELSSLFSGTRLPSGGIPGCLRIVFNLFVATRPLFLSHTMMATMNTTRKMPPEGHFPHFLKCHFGAQNSNGTTISWNIPHVVVKMAPETTFGSYWT